MVRFGLLGPLLVRVGEHVDVTAAKHRTVLALLIARRNTSVRLARIIGELWPERSPESAVHNVRTYISAIRTSLGHERNRLTTHQGSYTLLIDDDEVDTALFLAQVRLAKTASHNGQVAEALQRYAAALQLWRGEALQDVEPGPTLLPYSTALTESHITAREDYFAAAFEAGHGAESIAGLRQLAADNTMRESVWHRLISVLYRAGDRTAALEAFQDARRHLAEELGLDPGPELRALHVQILKGAPAKRPARPSPRQLLRAPTVFVGRETELAVVRRVLNRASGSSTIVAIHGLAGVGKSSLALAAAHAVAEHFPDGQLYVNLQGCTPGLAPLQPAEVLGRFMRALGVPEEQISPDTQEAAGWLRSITAERRVLFVLDDARSTAQVVPLLPAGPGCGVLITSRHQVDTLDGVEHLHLDVLSGAAAVRLLAELSGGARVGADPAAAFAIAQLCSLLPLAVRVMGIRLARHPEADLRQAADGLLRAQSRLDALGLDDLSVRSTFETGYHALPDKPLGQAARRLFWRLGGLPFAEVTADDAAALLDADGFTAQQALDVLSSHGLLEQTGTGYRIHDLLRLFAAELAAQFDSPEAARSAVTRLARTLTAFIRHNRLLYRPMDGDPPHEDANGGSPAGPKDEAEATTWINRNLPRIGGLVRQLANDPVTNTVAWDLLHPLTLRLCVVHPAACIQLYEQLIAEPASRGAPRMAGALCTLSTAQLYMRRRPDALKLAGEAMRLLPQLDDQPLRARILCVYATVLAMRPEGSGLALECFVEAITIYQSLGRDKPVSICLGNALMATYYLGLYDETLAIARRSLALTRRSGNPNSMASVLDGLAMVYLRTGRMKAAARCSTAGIQHCERIPNAYQHFTALQRRSIALQALGKDVDAIADAEAAVAMCGDDASVHLRLDALRNLGVILWLTGDPRAAAVLDRADMLGRPTADG